MKKLEPYVESELVIALVSAVGTDLSPITKAIKNKLNGYGYTTNYIKVSSDILQKHCGAASDKDEYVRLNILMDTGNDLRKFSEGFIGCAIANGIYGKFRNQQRTPLSKTAFIIDSLKNETELSVLKSIYDNGFYLIGVYSDEKKRLDYLVQQKNIDLEKAKKLVERDEDEDVGFGQHTRDTFQKADFFIDYSNNIQRMQSSVDRLLSLIFGQPFISPTFGEYAMFTAYSASLRSADLSRQIGTAICKNDEVIATGVNDCPKFKGELYWQYISDDKYIDDPNGRDYIRGYDPNKIEFLGIAEDILERLNLDKTEDNISRLRKSRLGDLTEYGRVVHSEMEALAMCARNGISCRDSEVYATTFPCHICAKHLIAAGIRKVVYIEPYPKSKAFDLFDDSITSDPNEKDEKLLFTPFFEVGPTRFLNAFAMKYSTLFDRTRKSKDGIVLKYTMKNAVLRDQMQPSSYIEREVLISDHFNTMNSEFMKGQDER